MFGVVILVIVVLIMVINWVKFIFNKCVLEKMVLGVLIVFSVIGLFSIILLIIVCYKMKRYIYNLKGIFFLKIKLILMNIFGVGFMFYCGLYFWKYFIDVKCNEYIYVLGRVYNMFLIVYILFLFVYFLLFYKRGY